MNTKVYFKNIQKIIIDSLESAEYEIDIAVAWFTDEKIISVLLDLVKSGIEVNILYYNDHINDKNLFQELYDNGANIRCSNSLMHNKFCIIDEFVVINGSYNWTNNAKYNNHENIQVTYDDYELVKAYRNEFFKLFEKNKKSEQLFIRQTDELLEKLLKEYLSKQSYPTKYPCFLKETDNWFWHLNGNGYVYILNEEMLYTYYKYKYRYKQYPLGIDPFCDNIYACVYIEKENNYLCNTYNGKFIYFDKYNILAEKEGESCIFQNGRKIRSFKYNEYLCPGLYLIVTDKGKKCLYNKYYKCYDLPDYFNPEKKYKFATFDGNGFLILRDPLNELEALIDVKGNVLIPPYYTEISIKEKDKIIECTEKPLFVSYHTFYGAHVCRIVGKEDSKCSRIVKYEFGSLNIISSFKDSKELANTDRYIYISDGNKSGVRLSNLSYLYYLSLYLKNENISDLSVRAFYETIKSINKIVWNEFDRNKNFSEFLLDWKKKSNIFVNEEEAFARLNEIRKIKEESNDYGCSSFLILLFIIFLLIALGVIK